MRTISGHSSFFAITKSLWHLVFCALLLLRDDDYGSRSAMNAGSNKGGVDASIISYNVSERTSTFTKPFLSSSNANGKSAKCPHACVCSHATVICTGQSLTYVPKGIPADTVRLDLQENKISIIKRTDFVGLQQLKILQLMDNEIQTIEDGAFDSLGNLERIRLNRNRLRALPDHLFRHNEKIHRLDLSENYLSVLTEDQLRGPRAMHNLQLDRNQLACVDSRLFAIEWADTLEILTLNANNLNTMGELSAMPNLRILRLADNPWHCDCRLAWMRTDTLLRPAMISNVKCARPAILQGRHVDSVDSQQLKCSGMEKRAVSTCSDASVCPTVCTCTDTTVDCHDRGLKHIPANLPATTTELRLEQNQITFIPRNAFQNLKHLVRLDLSKNNIHEISSGAFNGLSSLNTLMLYANSLTDLSADVFAPLRRLQLLLLNTNKLRCLRAKIFAGLNNLNLLSLYDNQIRSIARETFDDLKALQTLHLARNPLICDCNMEWLGALLTERAVETSGARCAAPRRLARRRLATLSPTKFRCKGSELFVTRDAGECFIDYDCPPQCFCHMTTVDCSGRDLAEIPSEIPRFTTELLLNRNAIREVTLKANLKHLIHLEKIDLSENRIAAIEENAFDEMNAIREINLTANQLRHFSAAMFGAAAKSLSILILNANQLQCVTSSTFGAFSNLRLLSLADNQLRGVTDAAFASTTKLHSMYLLNNQFACNCHLADFVRYLRKNGSEILFDAPKCAEPRELRGRELVTLDAEQLRCDAAQENVCAENGNYCPSGCACVGTVVRCSNRRLREFPTGIPPDTTELYLDNNEIDTIPLPLLNSLVSLVKLDLSQNRLFVVQNSTFARLSRLSTLILSYNRLRCLEARAFEGLQNLRILSLHANALSALPETAFAPIAANISHIALGANALHCDCTLAWFSRWIKARFVEPGIAKCETPYDLRNQLLLTASQSQFKCDVAPPQEVVAKCDACASSPCSNGGSCSRAAALSFTCACPVGYHGERCEHAIDACYGAPCLHDAQCELIQEGRFRCRCAVGFTGEHCETNVDDCATNRCANNATCVDGINAYECKCAPMFAGKFCEERLTFCSSSLNPCENGANCHPAGANNYTCACAAGFIGRNCSTNVDDCVAHKCQNGARCVDGVNGYTCKCALGYAGDHCETSTVNDAAQGYAYYSMATAAALSRRRDLSETVRAPSRHHRCTADNCQHGYCDFSLTEELEESRNDREADQHGVCRCRHGYGGRGCGSQTSVGFGASTTAFVALQPWRADAKMRRNLTLTLRTTQKTGVLVYYGDIPYIALELFDGRIKATFYVGNYPSSHIYSYAIVNDGRPHTVQALIFARELTLIVDDGSGSAVRAQRVLNSGKIDAFEPKTPQNFYLGGVPESVAHKALAAFHLKDARSLQGCISDVHVNGVLVDFAAVGVNAHNTVAGCASSVDLCAMVDCSGHGSCVTNASLADGFRCTCHDGFSGARCEKRSVECVKEKYRDYYVQDDCRSVERIKNARCMGWCGAATDALKSTPTTLRTNSSSGGDSANVINANSNDDAASSSGCCAAVRAKRRRVKMHCRDGGTRVLLVNIVRKCACRNECTTDASPALVF